jgi:hypothetical protein
MDVKVRLALGDPGELARSVDEGVDVTRMESALAVVAQSNEHVMPRVVTVTQRENCCRGIIQSDDTGGMPQNLQADGWVPLESGTRDETQGPGFPIAL